mgnify:CR=1 FL=1
MALILVFVNKSQLADWSDYDYQVLIGDGTPEHSQVLEHGTVMDHYRPWGWARLVEKLLTARTPEERIPLSAPLNPVQLRLPFSG